MRNQLGPPSIQNNLLYNMQSYSSLVYFEAMNSDGGDPGLGMYRTKVRHQGSCELKQSPNCPIQALRPSLQRYTSVCWT